MLLADGVAVTGTSRDAARLSALVQSWPDTFRPVALDLANPAEAEAVFRQAFVASDGAPDLLVNNAGYGIFGEFAATDFRDWEAQVQAMLTTTLRLTHAAWKPMVARTRAAIVNVSSLAVEFPLPFMSGYNVAKSGLSAFSESLCIESIGTGLTVIDFRPGDFRTAFNDSMQSHSTSTANPARLDPVWHQLEANLRNAPSPARAAGDLRRALLRRRCGTVRSGSFFQARVAPFLARWASASLRRAIAARYFGVR